MENSEGEILVGSSLGLLKIQDSVLIKVEDFRIQRPIYMLVNDQFGHLWVGSNNGVYRWNGTSLKHYSVLDGLAGNELNRDAGLLDSNNNLWLGTNNGLSVYKSRYDNSNDIDIPPPKIILSFAEVDGDTLSLKKNISLDHEKTNLTFNFKGISFIDEDQIYYKCLLEGLDEDWSAEFRTVQNNFRYFNLKPGEYRFCVKARNVYGFWSEPSCSELITIKSPFWIRWWFLLLSVLFIALLVFVISRSITQMKYAIRLEKTVKIRTRELNEAKEKAEESDRLKSSFLANMSHEIRTPMNGILGFAGLLREADLTGTERKKYIDIIEKSGDRMLNTINDIIDISRIESGEVKANFQKINLNVQLETLYDFFKPEADNKNVQLILKKGLENAVSEIHTDEEKIYAIFCNLIKNALKFTNEGFIEFGCSIEDRTMLCYVKDTGIGISSDKLERVFERFIMEDDSHTRVKQGSGLGLSIVKGYIELLGGKIWLESKVGKGSTFNFTLPINHDNEIMSEKLL